MAGKEMTLFVRHSFPAYGNMLRPGAADIIVHGTASLNSPVLIGSVLPIKNIRAKLLSTFFVWLYAVGGGTGRFIPVHRKFT